MRWTDIDFAANTISCVGELVRHKGERLIWEYFEKSDLSARTIPLPDGLVTIFRARKDALERLIPGGEATEAQQPFVFTSARVTDLDPEYAIKAVRNVMDFQA
ncbi:hypothetical protein [Brevibacterium metallidurans]|uniref:hypothetical protein n=1 Tax=Brevibacterium metallidurans TaxID=1482676 RepID=UPI0030DC6892